MKSHKGIINTELTVSCTCAILEQKDTWKFYCITFYPLLRKITQIFFLKKELWATSHYISTMFFFIQRRKLNKNKLKFFFVLTVLLPLEKLILQVLQQYFNFDSCSVETLLLIKQSFVTPASVQQQCSHTSAREEQRIICDASLLHNLFTKSPTAMMVKTSRSIEICWWS